MKETQTGFTLILLIIALAIIALMTGLYFTRGTETQKSQYETGQGAIEQAREINQQGSQNSRQIQEQLELQNDLNTR